MKKILLSIVLTLLISVTTYGENSQSNINVAAQGAILMDYKTGRILWEKNSSQPLAMASTTKIMTAIIAFENGNLSDVVTVSKRAAMAPEVNMNLSAGEEIRLEDLLYALMLQSYNDAAIAIAEHISGSVEAFCILMTEKATELGAKDTVFETPNGLDSGNHHSTAYDLAVITRYAISNEDFMNLINTPYKSVTTSKRQYDLQNRNRLLNEYQGANGVKTGFTGKAGQCFVGAAQRDGMQLISVVLASGWGNTGKEQKWIDTKRILDYGFSNYKYTDLIIKDTSCTAINVTRTKTPKIELLFSENVTLPLNIREISELKISYDYPSTIKAPIEQGQVLGTCTVALNGYETQIDLVSAQNAQRHDFATSLKKVLKEWTQMSTNQDLPIEKFDFIDILEY